MTFHPDKLCNTNSLEPAKNPVAQLVACFPYYLTHTSQFHQLKTLGVLALFQVLNSISKFGMTTTLFEK